MRRIPPISRWPMNVHNALVATLVLTITTAVAGLLVSKEAEKTLLDHEITDIKDETALRTAEFRRMTLRTARELDRLTRTKSPGDFQSDWLKKVRLGAALEREESVTGSGGLWDESPVTALFVHPPAAGQVPPATFKKVIAYGNNDGTGVATAGSFAQVLTSPGVDDEAVLSSPFDLDAGGVCRTYLACRFAADRSMFLVAEFNVTQYFQNLSRTSPRQLYYVVAQKGGRLSYLFHPKPQTALVGEPVSGAAEWMYGGDNAFAGLKPSHANTGLNNGEARNVLDPKSRSTVLSVAAPMTRGDEELLYHTKRAVAWPAPLPPDARDRCLAYNSAMKAMAPDGLRFTELRVPPGGAAGEKPAASIELACPSEETLGRAKRDAEAALGDWLRSGWSPRELALGLVCKSGDWRRTVDNEESIAAYAALDTGLVPAGADPDGTPMLVVTASIDEIKQDVWVETFPTLLAVVLLSILIGSGVALVMTWTVTRPLRKMRNAAYMLAEKAKAGDANITLSLDKLPKSGPREVVSLSESLRNMVDAVASLFGRITDLTAKFGVILKNAPDGIVVIDGVGAIVEANDKFAAMVRVPDSRHLHLRSIREFLSKHGEAVALPPDSTFADPSDDGSYAASFWTKGRVVLSATRADGSHFFAGASFTPLTLGGQIHYTAVVRDMTREVENEQVLNDRVKAANGELVRTNEALKLAVKAKDFFMANVSHELRAPLTVISGEAQMLLRGNLTPQVEKRVRRIYESMTYQTALVNDILDCMKIIEGQLELRPKAFALGPFVEKVAAEMHGKAAEGGNRVVVECPPDLGEVYQDDVRLKQVLYNLLTNAAKFTRDGTITVSCGPAGGGLLRLAVRDEGRGLSPDDLAKLRDPQPYGKLKNRELNREGTGLGLVICKGLCEKMGGGLTVESGGPGLGSTFAVTFRRHLPEVAARPSSRGPAPARTPAPAAAAPTRLSVLIVDDEASTRDNAAEMLGEKGFEVHVAKNDAEALKSVRDFRPAVILLDIFLRDSANGWAILKLLKEDPGLCDIPVIIVSVNDEPGKAHEYGAARHVVKPIEDWDKMARTIRDVLN